MSDLKNEIGIGAIAHFEGKEPPKDPTERPDEYERYVEAVAELAMQLGVPYLLGIRSNFDELKEYITKHAQTSIDEVSEYRFPKNVREEWL